MPAPLAVLALLVDVVLLAGLLDLTGGPFNPFTVVFGVHVALAARDARTRTRDRGRAPALRSPTAC